MTKVNKDERLSRLIKVSGLIAAGIVDAPVVGELKKAVLKYVATQSIGTDQALKNLYQGENELGILVRKAFAVIDDDQNFRSAATGAIYPKGDRWYLDLLRDPGDSDEDDRDDDDDDGNSIEKASDSRGAHGLVGSLLDHLHDRLSDARRAHGFEKSKTEKELSTMNRTQELRDIAKGGIIAVAKAMTDENRSFGITEHEFVELATEDAQKRFPDKSPAAAFAKLFTDGGVDSLILRKAHAVVKASHAEQMFGPTFPAVAKANRSKGTAYNELLAKAEELRNAHPELSISQAFEKIYTARNNVELAKRERIESAPR
jgi:hypothetical protein